MTMDNGVRGFADWKFWTVLSLYFGACLCFFESGAGGRGMYIVFPLLMAYAAMSTVAWQHKILGSPYRAHTLVLHLALWLVLFFYFNRILVSFDENIGLFFEPVTGVIETSAIAGFLFDNPVLSFVKAVMSSVFSSVVALALFIFLSIVLSFRRSWSVPALATLLLLMPVPTFRLGLGPTVAMLAGMAFAFAALRLQMEDARQSRFWNKVRDRFGMGNKQPRIMVELKLDLLERLFEKPRLYEEEIRGVAARRLGCGPTDSRLTTICRSEIEDLSFKESLIEPGANAFGQYVALPPDLETDCVFSKMAMIPRGIILILFTMIYYFSPIDLIPDYLPVFGILDDLAVCCIGGAAGVLSLLGVRKRAQPSGLFAAEGGK